MAQEAGTGTPWRMAAATVDAAGTRLRRLPPDPETAARRACNLLRPPAA